MNFNYRLFIFTLAWLSTVPLLGVESRPVPRHLLPVALSPDGKSFAMGYSIETPPNSYEPGGAVATGTLKDNQTTPLQRTPWSSASEVAYNSRGDLIVLGEFPSRDHTW